MSDFGVNFLFKGNTHTGAARRRVDNMLFLVCCHAQRLHRDVLDQLLTGLCAQIVSKQVKP